MECPKCHKNIPDDATNCPYCHKVLTLVCPNCRTLGQSTICSKCGYIILEKCAKCGRMVSTSAKKCKCGYPVASTVACNECETDEFASVTIKFGALKAIRRILGSQELYTKFLAKLKNILTIHFKSIEGNVIIYSDTVFVVNFSKELSFATSVNKAIRFALKIVNSFSGINLNVIEELGTPLKLGITVIKKSAEEFLQNKSYENNLKLLMVKRNEKKYLRGMQIILDESSRDCIEKEYKTDSLYSIEKEGRSIMFYELLLENYMLPPNEKNIDEPANVTKNNITKNIQEEETVEDIYSFRVFDINVDCKFKKTNAVNLFNVLDSSKIISIRGDKELLTRTSDIAHFYEKKGYNVVRVSCTEELNYKPWGVLEQIFRDAYELPVMNTLVSETFVKNNKFAEITALLFGKVRKALTPDDVRFAYMEDFIKFFSTLKKCVILIEGFENLDDTTIQTLNLYFDNYKRIVPTFVFLTDSEVSLHSKIKNLLRTNLYTEFYMNKSAMDTVLGQMSEDAADFIHSFYYEKIKENYNGSLLYFDNAIKLLKEKDVLISFENKLLIKNSNSVILPIDLGELLRSRLKYLSKNVDASMILAYSVYLGSRLDYKLLETLGVNDIDKNAKILQESGFVDIKNEFIYINNYNLIKPVLTASIKKETENFLIKNILSKIAKELNTTTLLLLTGKVEMFKEECKCLWENAMFSMSTGDYDSYLKNCLGYLSIIEHIEGISAEDIENNKKEVFQNILMSLYSYSPEKIYSIENVLLIDAIKENDNEKIIRLSNLMLQSALLSANYTDAIALLHNILTRMANPTLIVDGAVNSHFLLLSLINIEILFNIGEFKDCIETAKELLSVIKPEIIEKIKPRGFSLNLFVEHLLDTFRLACLAILISGDIETLDEYMDSVKNALNAELPDKDSIIAIKNYLAGKGFVPSNTEEAGAFSKVIYLILQEFTENRNNYKEFAQNIYHAKLLSADIHQKQIELFCDLLIAYSYANINIAQKAEAIYNDVLKTSEDSAIFNIILASKYFMALNKLSLGNIEDALLIINDALAQIQSGNNQAKLFFVLFEKMFIDLVKSEKISSIDLESEEQKLAQALENGAFAGIIK